MYEVFDNYDLDMESLGTAKNESEVRKICKERYDDTDGECWLLIKKNGKDVDVRW